MLLAFVEDYGGYLIPIEALSECRCQPGEACECGDNCRCHEITRQPVKVAKPVISVARFDRVNNDPYAPITRAPDPDYDALEAQLEAENSVRRVPSSKPFVSNFRSDDAPAAGQIKAASPSGPPRVMPTKAQPPAFEPIEKAAMVVQCNGDVCEYVPASSVTQQAPRRRWILGRLRGRW